MPYIVVSPNANQSPGLFPAQANENFQRLLDIINQDHNFTASSAVNQGTHKQVGLINVPPSSLPFTTLPDINARLYSAIDATTSASQLYFYNGAATYQLTPQERLYPIRVVGTSNAVGAGLTVTAYADPGFQYCGTGWSGIVNSASFTFYNIIRAGSNDLHSLDNNNDTATPPTFTFSGNILQIKNNSASIQNLRWSLIINRIT